MVREFTLLNENNQKFSLMDIYNYCLLTEPSGLGLSYETEYAQLGNVFVSNFRRMTQNKIGGTANFYNYDNYKKFVDFIEKSNSLKILYTIPFEEGEKSYYRDVNIAEIGKTEINHSTGILSEPIVLECLSLWYEPRQFTYNLEKGTNEIIWNFMWDSSWIGFNSSNIEFTNDGHVPATIKLDIDGEVVNPTLELYVENELKQTIDITDSILIGEKFRYSSKENDFYIKKQLVDGTEENLFTLDNINFSQDLVIRFPQGKTSSLKITSDTDIQKATLTVFVYYKVV